ncbi:MAG: SDR family oxidoreductase [Microthrixaceae bacterium]|nr:SDR family oxidoreductase [Microthrixaceae bacterium]MCB9386768.1 SDR family oxidoreductase [Microthrixaceae bacterium]MCO5320571.1 SDR family oxidoreductase [Microthrixaceae bacterium]
MGAALKGSTALVTGGGSGIGLGAAKAFAVDGASVLIVGRSQDKLDAALEELSPLVHDGASVSSLSTDVTEESQVEAAVAAAGELPGKLSIAVASAGDGTIGPIVGTSVEEWDRVQSVSLRGVFLTFKHAGAAIAANGGGALVAVSSLAGLLTHRFMGPYNVAKAGVDMLVRTTADEMGAVGVRANGVNPGIIRTDLVAMVTEDSGTGKSYLRNSPVSRFGEVDDVAAAIRFLAGPESSFITGVNLPIDGGHHLRRGPDYSEITAAMYSEVVDPRIVES